MIPPYSESSEQNKEPILKVLKQYLNQVEHVLEIGSGTGQHAVFFASQFPHLTWHTSDVEAHHAGISAWIESAGLPNVADALLLDVNQHHWSDRQFDFVFSANTAHIMDWNSVGKLFSGVGRVLKASACFALYGPFNYQGSYTSDSNARFDQWLKARDPLSGIRDFEALQQLAAENALAFVKDHAMPANNRTLVWRKL